MSQQGIFIVIDGIDGSGKCTQAQLLIKHLEQLGRTVYKISFPRYDKPAATGVKLYLNGEFGTKEQVSPKLASYLYAADRYDAAVEIREQLAAGAIVISDRYVSANKGHQLAKISHDQERLEFLTWLNTLEYELLGIPKPDHTILMNMPADIAYDLIAKKDERAYLNGKVRDIHEMDQTFLQDSQQAFLFAAQHDNIEHWHVLNCVEHGVILSIEDMHTRVRNFVQTIL